MPNQKLAKRRCLRVLSNRLPDLERHHMNRLPPHMQTFADTGGFVWRFSGGGTESNGGNSGQHLFIIRTIGDSEGTKAMEHQQSACHLLQFSHGTARVYIVLVHVHVRNMRMNNLVYTYLIYIYNILNICLTDIYHVVGFWEASFLLPIAMIYRGFLVKNKGIRTCNNSNINIIII